MKRIKITIIFILFILVQVSAKNNIRYSIGGGLLFSNIIKYRYNFVYDSLIQSPNGTRYSHSIESKPAPGIYLEFNLQKEIKKIHLGGTLGFALLRESYVRTSGIIYSNSNTIIDIYNKNNYYLFLGLSAGYSLTKKTKIEFNIDKDLYNIYKNYSYDEQKNKDTGYRDEIDKRMIIPSLNFYYVPKKSIISYRLGISSYKAHNYLIKTGIEINISKRKK